MSNLPHPLYLDYKNWANQTRLGLNNLNIPVPPSVENWRIWANQVTNQNPIANFPIPTKISYPNDEDWRKWALRFYAIVKPKII